MAEQHQSRSGSDGAIAGSASRFGIRKGGGAGGRAAQDKLEAQERLEARAAQALAAAASKASSNKKTCESWQSSSEGLEAAGASKPSLNKKDCVTSPAGSALEIGSDFSEEEPDAGEARQNDLPQDEMGTTFLTGTGSLVGGRRPAQDEEDNMNGSFLTGTGSLAGSRLPDKELHRDRARDKFIKQAQSACQQPELGRLQPGTTKTPPASQQPDLGRRQPADTPVRIQPLEKLASDQPDLGRLQPAAASVRQDPLEKPPEGTESIRLTVRKIRQEAFERLNSLMKQKETLFEEAHADCEKFHAGQRREMSAMSDRIDALERECLADRDNLKADLDEISNQLTMDPTSPLGRNS